MLENGLLFGSFNPLHLSHIELMKKALESFATLHVFVRCTEGVDLVDWETKKSWLERVNEELDGRLKIYKMDLSLKDKSYDKLDMVGIFLEAEKQAGVHIDGLICGEDMQYMVDTFIEKLPDRTFIVIKRDGRSSTNIRSDINAMTNEIPDYVLEDVKGVLSK